MRLLLVSLVIVGVALTTGWMTHPELRAKPGPLLQLSAMVGLGCFLYLNALGDLNRWRGLWRPAVPRWLTMVCGRPEADSLILPVALSQVAAAGMILGEVGWFIYKPETALAGGIVGMLVAVSLTAFLWFGWWVIDFFLN